MTSTYLLDKYNIPAPRYTSYPTVPYWEDHAISQQMWLSKVESTFSQGREISLYIHLPYCEKLCTYCGCNKRITKNHQVERPYIEHVLQEWAMYCEALPERPILKELHLGGGTPTFFSPDNLQYLITGILAKAEIAGTHEFGFEAHPNSCTEAHLQTLYDLGFNRISVGVQDFAPEIMQIINREQSTEDIERVTNTARRIGYQSINFDLIFGLPLQTPAHIRTNMQMLARLRPDRLAFYSYAHVPWVKPSQRAYSEADLPKGKAKRHLYELGRALLEELGYREIGMDHFALPGDSLYKAFANGSLHRNFMGYTPLFTRLSIGLGASAISDSWDGYIQNEKTIEGYQRAIAAGKLPFFRGHMLSEEDQIIRAHILNLMCRQQTEWKAPELQCDAVYAGLERLDESEKDALVERLPMGLKVTTKGQPFIRNICMALDSRYWQRQPEGQIFSQVV